MVVGKKASLKLRKVSSSRASGEKNNGSVGSGDDASGTLHSARASDIPMFSLVDASRIR